jgi:hypothetical protein
MVLVRAQPDAHVKGILMNRRMLIHVCKCFCRPLSGIDRTTHLAMADCLDRLYQQPMDIACA